MWTLAELTQGGAKISHHFSSLLKRLKFSTNTGRFCMCSICQTRRVPGNGFSTLQMRRVQSAETQAACAASIPATMGHWKAGGELLCQIRWRSTCKTVHIEMEHVLVAVSSSGTFTYNLQHISWQNNVKLDRLPRTWMHKASKRMAALREVRSLKNTF